MAWATTNKVGCSIVKCLNEYVVDCRYLEKGNVVEKQVYVPGALCSMCAKCNENGLCV
ncbi:hypothetical protein OESDEN_10960 [Oesophagostomum dentatum]|uniref:SCP domain-containing protein n=1 Tax=Oesophagostomum dentatum TaxID=61180 RepID=A0A0B1SZA0_OESDE|nr:hypothetical protein OESDEN_10960 [Oesophagostomum dentatum]